jgi:hypothetical protein
MRCHDLHILDMPLAVTALALQAKVRELHVLVDHRELVLTRPSRDLDGISLRASRTGPATTIRLLQERLVLTLQLLLEDDAPNLQAAFIETPTDLEIRAMDTGVVGELAGLGDAGVVRLMRFGAVLAPRGFEDLPAAVRQRDERRALASHDVRHRADEVKAAEPLDILAMYVRAIVRPSQFIYRDDAKGSGGGEHADLGASQVPLPIPHADTVAARAAREVQIPRQRVPRVINNRGAAGFTAATPAAGHIRSITVEFTGVDVSMHGRTPYACPCGPRSSSAASDVPS